MNPLFKNETKYNKKNYEEFVKFHAKKFSFSYNLYNIVMIILLILCVITSIKEKQFILLILFIALLLLFLLFRLYLPYKRQEKNENLYKKNKETLCNYSFYKLYFVVNNHTFYYFKLYKIYETEDYFYLYLNDDYATLVSKSGFTLGNVDDFRSFIKKNCLLKYRKSI